MDEELVSVARRIIDGGEVADVDFANFRRSDAEKAVKAADMLWYYCRQFQDDADIRTKELEYDKAQRDAVGWRLEQYLQVLGEVG